MSAPESPPPTLRLDDAARGRLWPAFDEAWIVFEDDDLLAIDKPEGVSCQAADPAHPDDLVHRLGLHRPGAYVGVHQRLDQDTSGVLVYTKRREVNRPLAQQLEGRQVEKRYVAVVRGWRGGPRRLEHGLVKGEGGRVVVARPRDRRAKIAITHARPIESAGDLTLLELRLETGRTHQIRAQLAAVGAPIEGDPRYGGSPAPRLMLHAASLSLRHPGTGAPLRVEAPIPAALTRHLRAQPEPLEDRLERALAARWGLAHRGVDALRVVHRDGDALDAFAVDLYGPFAVLHVYDEDAPIEAALDWLGARLEGVYVKRRPRQGNVIVDGRDDDYAPGAPARGRAAPEVALVLEHGLPFHVRLGEGLSTGLFLDQRDARGWVLGHAGGARVLNLFCYTGAFTVAAAAGGARATVSVDASGRLLDWARENLDGASLLGPAHRLEQADCFVALDALARGGERFDLVIVDPPTYSSTRTTRWTSGKAWRDLAARCLRVLAPGGRLLASSNDHRMTQARFRRHLHDAARDAEAELAQLKDLRPPRDFPPGPAGPHLKAALATRA